MKYLFLSNSIGGLKSFRTEIIEKILKQGDAVHICSPLEISADFFESKGCIIHPIKLARHGINPFSEFELINEYTSIIKSISPDIIFSYTIKPNIYGSIAAKLCKVPIIASVTGLGSAIENGGDFKTQTLDNLAIVLGVSVDFIMYGKNEENSELLSEAMDVLSDMDELQIRQCLAMMKAMKSVSVEK